MTREGKHQQAESESGARECYPTSQTFDTRASSKCQRAQESSDTSCAHENPQTSCASVEHSVRKDGHEHNVRHGYQANESKQHENGADRRGMPREVEAFNNVSQRR